MPSYIAALDTRGPQFESSHWIFLYRTFNYTFSMNKWSVRCLQLPTAVLKFHYGCAKGFRHGVTRFESQLWNTV